MEMLIGSFVSLAGVVALIVAIGGNHPSDSALHRAYRRYTAPAVKGGWGLVYFWGLPVFILLFVSPLAGVLFLLAATIAQVNIYARKKFQ